MTFTVCHGSHHHGFFQNGMAHLFLCPWESTRIYSSWDSVPRLFFRSLRSRGLLNCEKMLQKHDSFYLISLYTVTALPIVQVFTSYPWNAIYPGPLRQIQQNVASAMHRQSWLPWFSSWCPWASRQGPWPTGGTNGHRGMAELSGLGGIATVPWNAFSPNCDSLWHLGP